MERHWMEIKKRLNYLCIKMTKLLEVENFTEKGMKIDPLLKNSCFCLFYPWWKYVVFILVLKDADPTLFYVFSFIFPSVFINISTLLTSNQKNKRHTQQKKEQEREYYFQFSILRCRYHQQDLKSCKNILLLQRNRC